VLGHVGINVPDLAAARRYYSAIMPRVGFERYLDADDEFAYRPLAGKPGTYLFFYPSAEQSRYSQHQAGLQHLASTVRFMGSPRCVKALRARPQACTSFRHRLFDGGAESGGQVGDAERCPGGRCGRRRNILGCRGDNGVRAHVGQRR
jgi:catechol 2,3-dioxygenase-like lactoylglutathione lyase family enzyme